MKLENQVSSLAPSLRLKELGVPQTYQPYDAYWVKLSNGEWRLMFLETQEDPPTQTPFEHCRAFTVAELGEMLPPGYGSHKVSDITHVTEFQSTFDEAEYSCTSPYKEPYQVAKTEADARAKMLIYLIENKLISV